MYLKKQRKSTKKIFFYQIFATKHTKNVNLSPNWEVN